MTPPRRPSPISDPSLARPVVVTSKRLAIGDRVQLSEDGREHYRGLAFDGTRGVVVGFTRKRVGYVRIKLDTTAAPRQFHERDWEKVPTADRESV